MPTQSETGECKKRHFVLVHGGCHGAWVWHRSKLVSLLESAGHKVTAVDLAGCGDSPIEADDITSFEEYNRPLIDLFSNSISTDEKVILVGHAMGGLNATAITQQFPEKIAVAVYLVALMLNNVAYYDSQLVDPTTSTEGVTFYFKNGPDAPPTSMSMTASAIRTSLYQLSPVEDQDYAIEHTRPCPTLVWNTKIILTPEKYGEVPRVFIHAKDDLMLLPNVAKLMLNMNPPKEELTIPGDHMVIFSSSSALFEILDSIANRY